MGCAAALLLSLGASPAHAQTVAVMVNGEPITDYDIEQRSKLNFLTTHKPADRKEIIRLVVERVVVHVHAGTECGEVVISWRGGATTRNEIVRTVARYESLGRYGQMIDRIIEMRQQVAAPPALVEELLELLERREFKEIYALVKADKTFLSRLLATGIAELPSGLAEARDAMERVGEAVTVEMEKKISMLAVIGTLGPMIGLLGTLKGMIASFSVIALSDVQLKASQVAGGISEALLLTFEGVALSVPAIYFFAIFRNRVSSISVATLLEADEFLRHFAHTARVKAQPAQSVTPKPAES